MGNHRERWRDSRFRRQSQVLERRQDRAGLEMGGGYIELGAVQPTILQGRHQRWLVDRRSPRDIDQPSLRPRRIGRGSSADSDKRSGGDGRRLLLPPGALATVGPFRGEFDNHHRAVTGAAQQAQSCAVKLRMRPDQGQAEPGP